MFAFDRDRTAAFKQEIERHGTVIITRHERPDGDALGTTFGLRAALRAMYPDKNVICVSPDSSEKLSFLGSEDADVATEIYRDALVIVADCGSASQIANPRWNSADFTVRIDHHRGGEDFAGLSFVFPDASAASEIAAELVLDCGIGRMTAVAAGYFYAGIVTDTGGFRFSFSPETFATSARLLDFGFDARTLTDRLFMRSRKEAELAGVLNGMIRMTPGGAAYIKLDNDVWKALGMTREEAGDTVNLMSGIDGIPVWAAFIGEDNGTYSVRLRGRGANVRPVAEKHGGGGHDGASGAKLPSEDGVPAVIAELDRLAATVTSAS